MKWTVTAVAALAAGWAAWAVGPQDPRKDQLKTALKDDAVKGDWIYDDLSAGYAQAKKSGKPMLVVFR